ncbi:Oxidation resistance protein 1 [Cytospora mali]|uniref:Oxidation resistance protein 1 n=1 Tax=Cytospora mali TaxID=578113 RepID=A0A194W7A1_CYTMA|nr:Oxidation resistance protein 1 [Valsa mali]
MPYNDRIARHGEYSPSSSGAATPTTPSASSSVFLSNPISGLASGFGGLVRRFSDMTTAQPGHHSQNPASSYSPSRGGSPLSYPHHRNNGISGVYTPPIHRSASPMRPPPLEPLELKGFREDTSERARLLTSAVAEEIRIMVPERQRIEDEWNLVYSLDQDGASLGTLYKKCSPYEGTRSSFVLVIRDNDGGLFGAYLSDAPHPSAHYFGNGECFLWRASVLAALPPPPSVDTTNLSRVTTITSPTQTRFPRSAAPPSPPPPQPEPEEELLIDFSDDPPASQQPPPQATPAPTLLQPTPALHPQVSAPTSRSASPMSPSIRFKAFPYSGENDFNIYCEHHTLSIGGGDGHYGLWLNDSLDKGVSSRCLTFGNEPLSDEGEKFGVLGVEVWLIGRGERR